jgi:hypothetical protein
MIKFDSPLRRLPPGLDRSDALVLDGIRHAAEIATLSDRRLRETLTTIATSDDNGSEQSAARITAAYLDAWAIVDSLDRLRALVELVPEAPGSEGHTKFLSAQLQSIRGLRNVADHLATRIDYVVAKKTPALGYLRWLTLTEQLKGLTCVLAPGTLPEKLQFAFANQAGRKVQYPTGRILLAAGEYEACLCDAMEVGSQMIRGLEEGLRLAVEEHGLQGQAVGADLFARGEIVFFDTGDEPSVPSP